MLYRLIIRYTDGCVNNYYMRTYGECLAIIERELKINAGMISSYFIEECEGL